MKILWFTNREFVPRDEGYSGTWLQPLAEEINKSGNFQIANLAYGKTDKLIKKDCGAIQQWIIPYSKPNREGLPAKTVIEEILGVHSLYAPDIVHFWGVEYFWGLLAARNYIKTPALLDIQGLTHEIVREYTGGLSIAEQFKCIGPREIILGTTMFQDQRRLFRWGKYEKEIIRSNKYIIAQSPWIEAKVRGLNPTSNIFHNELALRPPFYTAKQWHQKSKQNVRIFCSASYLAPFKGVHVAIRAIARLKNEFPTIQLRLAGLKQSNSIRKYGYISWLEELIKEHDVRENVIWLGYLSASEIVNELQLCSAAIVSSFTESYCVALAEAMFLGVPTVTSFTGGTSYLAKDGETALFFPIGDVEMCAFQIQRLLNDNSLTSVIAQKGREIGLQRNNLHKIADQEVSIYSNVFDHHQVLM
jgi:glycosyltransferase involved in cell wall biosynthesis